MMFFSSRIVHSIFDFLFFCMDKCRKRATNSILIIDVQTIWTFAFTVKTCKYPFFCIHKSNRNITCYHWLFFLSLFFHFLSCTNFHVLWNYINYHIYMPVFFLLFCICEQINCTAEKLFPGSLVLAHWNSGKYADVGCFAGKVDRGQMWLFLFFRCLERLQIDI